MPNNSLNRATFAWESPRELQLKNMDEMIDRLEQQLRVTETIKAQNAPSTEDVASPKVEIEDGQALIDRLRQAKVVQRVVLEMQP